jgi:hypothetical protein
VIIVTIAVVLNLPLPSFNPLCVLVRPLRAVTLLPESPLRGPLSAQYKHLARAHSVISEVKMVKMDVDSSLDAQTPILENMVVGVPPVFEGLTKSIEKIVEQPLLGPKTRFPAGENLNVIPACAVCIDQLYSDIRICA